MHHDDAGGGEIGGCDRRESVRGEHLAHARTQFELRRSQLLEPAVARLDHRGEVPHQGVGGHCCVVGRAPGTVLVGDRQPLREVHREARRGAGGHGLPSGFAEHDVTGPGGSAPALLRCTQQHVDAELLHVDPDRAGSDAVEHEQTADLVGGVGERADVVIGQDHARGRLDVRGEDDLRLTQADRRDNVVDRRGRPRGLHVVAVGSGGEDGDVVADATGIQDLRPAEGEQTVAHDKGAPPRRDLTGDGLHRVGAAAGDDRRGVRVVRFFEDAEHLLHHVDEARGHVVEGTVCEDHRVLEEAPGVDIIVRKCGHAPSIPYRVRTIENRRMARGPFCMR